MNAELRVTITKEKGHKLLFKVREQVSILDTQSFGLIDSIESNWFNPRAFRPSQGYFNLSWYWTFAGSLRRMGAWAMGRFLSGIL
jgi:hypothetical protein